MKTTIHFLVTFFVVLGSISAVYGTGLLLRDFGPSPEFAGIDSDENEFNSTDVLKNKISIVNFFFTTCEGPCPSLMLNVKKILTKTECSDVQFISITVDPETDTSSVLKKYRETRGFEQSNWHFISMTQGDLERLLNQGFKLGSGGEIVNHSTRFVVIDQDSKIRAMLPGMDNDAIDKTIDAIHKLCS
jgi:protein SCO1/2